MHRAQGGTTRPRRSRVRAAHRRAVRDRQAGPRRSSSDRSPSRPGRRTPCAASRPATAEGALYSAVSYTSNHVPSPWKTSAPLPLAGRADPWDDSRPRCRARRGRRQGERAGASASTSVRTVCDGSLSRGAAVRSCTSMATTKQETRLSDEQLAEVMELARGADSVELKLTRAGDRPALDRRGARRRPARRADPPGLLLRHARPRRSSSAGVVVARPPRPGQGRRLRRQAAAGRAGRPPEAPAALARLRRRGRRHARRLRLLGVAEGHAGKDDVVAAPRGTRRCASSSPRSSGRSTPSTRRTGSRSTT